MSDPRDRDDMRDPTLDAAWRAHSTELPPQHVDAAILAAGRREVGAKPRAADGSAQATRAPRAWWGLAAAATIAAVAFGIMQFAPHEEATLPPPVTDVPSTRTESRAPATDALSTKPSVPTATPRSAPPQASTDSASSAQPTPPSKGQRPAPAPKHERPSQPARDRAQASMMQERAAKETSADAAQPELKASAPAGAPRPFPGAEAPMGKADELAKRQAEAPRESQAATNVDKLRGPAVASEAPVSRGLARRDERFREADRPAVAPAAPEPRAVRSSDAFIARIVALFNAGQRDEAERELRAFREAYVDADQRLPESLRGWAASVKH